MKTKIVSKCQATLRIMKLSGTPFAREFRSHCTPWVCMKLLLVASIPYVWTEPAAAETVTYYYTNLQGTVLATADATGGITNNTDYRPYGSQASGTPEQGPGYAGHVNDVDTGLVYMQQRYYDPAVGRFLSVDPVRAIWRSTSHTNRYGYANDNPYRFIDPDGRATVAVGATFNAAALAGGTISGQLTFSFVTWNPGTWRLGGYGSVGGLATTDVGVGAGVAMSYSQADSAEEMASASSNGSVGGAINAFGASVGYERSLCTDCTAIRTLTVGTKISVAPVEIHTSVTRSAGMTWLGSRPVNPTVTVGAPTTAPPPPPQNPQSDEPNALQRELKP